jgi:hypothetical protein
MNINEKRRHHRDGDSQCLLHRRHQWQVGWPPEEHSHSFWKLQHFSPFSHVQACHPAVHWSVEAPFALATTPSVLAGALAVCMLEQPLATNRTATARTPRICFMSFALRGESRFRELRPLDEAKARPGFAGRW